MSGYPEDQLPVGIMYKKSDTNKVVGAKSVFNMHNEKGMDSGECTFIVHWGAA